MTKRRTSRQRRAASEESHREQHARLVTDRHLDPSFVHRKTVGDQTVVSIPAGPMAEQFAEALGIQQAAFREKFGRDIGPDDPVFFDPDADEPQPINMAHWHEGLQRITEDAAAAGLDPSWFLAMRDVGYLVTEANKHLFSLAEIDQYDQAVDYYQSFEDPLQAPPFSEPYGTEQDNDDETDEVLADEGPGGLMTLILETVDTLVTTRKARAAQAIMALLDEFAEYGDDASPMGAFTMATAIGFVAAVEQDGPANGYDRGVALTWVRENLGRIAHTAAARAAEAGAAVRIGQADAAARDALARLSEDLRDQMIPACLWLLAGAVATAGQSDTSWLFRLIPGAGQ